MATEAWLIATKNSLKRMIESPLTIRSISDDLARVYLAMKENIPVQSALSQPAPMQMFSVIGMMLAKAMEFLEKNGSSLPGDEFSMQYHRLTLSADKSKISLYYSRGFAFPIDYLGPKDTGNIIELASR